MARYGFNPNEFDAPTAKSRTLARCLRTIRKDAGWTSRHLEQRLHVAHSDIALWEQGKRIPKVEDLAAYLAHLAIPQPQFDFILGLRSGAHDVVWTAPGSRKEFEHAAAVEACMIAARTITIVAPAYIPEVFQTSEYAAALGITRDFAWDGEENRLLKQPRRLRALISEAAIRTPVGNVGVMRRQWRALAQSMAADEHVDIRIVPADAEVNAFRQGTLTLYEFRLGNDIAHVEQLRHGTFYSDSSVVRQFRHGISTLLMEASLGEEDSQAFLAGLLN